MTSYYIKYIYIYIYITIINNYVQVNLRYIRSCYTVSAYMHICVYTHMSTYARTYTHTHTHTHTRTHVYIVYDIDSAATEVDTLTNHNAYSRLLIIDYL